MNQIDKKFFCLVNYIKTLTTQEIYSHIKAFFDQIPTETKKSLEDYFKKFPYWGTLDLKTNNYDELYQKAGSLSNHIEDYIWLYQHLEDYRSKKLLYAVLNNWYQYDFQTLKECQENTYPDYFDLDIVKCDEKEVFVDLGAYIGDTALDFINMYNQTYKKMYLYEITEETFNRLKNNLSKYPNIEYRNKAASDTSSKMYLHKSSVDASANSVTKEGTIEVETTTIDEDIKEKVTIIKMDIEGSEQRALLGCKNHIQKDHPKLLLSVYHNNEDIWKIPRMIDEICPGYQFYLRNHGGNIFPTEITLIAIYPMNKD